MEARQGNDGKDSMSRGADATKRIDECTQTRKVQSAMQHHSGPAHKPNPA
jgi:hypothetical protein